jgi:hypothetical protein
MAHRVKSPNAPTPAETVTGFGLGVQLRLTLNHVEGELFDTESERLAAVFTP